MVKILLVSLQKKSDDAKYYNDYLSAAAAGTPILATVMVDPICKICDASEARFVVLPCAHLSMCLECVCTQDYCPLCRKRIKFLLKIFIA